MYLSVIVPAFNEEKKIEKNIEKYNNYLKQQKYSYEIIIVNDGSLDNTKKNIENIIRKNSKVKLINLKKNYGKGYAVKEGMLKAQGDFHLFLDADNSTSIEHLNKAMPLLLKKEDIVIGSRSSFDHQNSKVILSQPFWRVFLGKIGNFLIRILFKIKIRDTQCGFKIFSSSISQKIFSNLTINRWLFDLEIIVLAKKYGVKINIIPVEWENDKDSKLKLKEYFYSFLELLHIKYNLMFKKY